MSVLIKGMEMPKKKNGAVLIIYPDGRCAFEDGKEYKVVPIPPHGRLIDADAINHEDEIWKKKCIPQQVVYNAWVVAGEMPTVIPADKDGET